MYDPMGFGDAMDRIVHLRRQHAQGILTDADFYFDVSEVLLAFATHERLWANRATAEYVEAKYEARLRELDH